MRILVTGANGQVGHELLRALAGKSPPLQGEGLGGDGGDAGAVPNTIPTPALPLKGRETSAQRSSTKLRTGLKGRGNSGASCEIIPATRSGTLENGTPCERIDLADPDELRSSLERIKPDLITNAAAYTAVDRAEDEPELTQRINGDAVGVIGGWAAVHGTRVVHYSTDYVFDGSATRPYREDDATHPLGVYGRSKLAGEVALRESGARHLILRTAWVYAARGRNFLRTMLRFGAECDEMRVVDDQVGAPTSAASIADVTATVVGRWFGTDDMRSGSWSLDGTYHVVASGQTSWCGFARAIFERAAVAGVQSDAPRVTAIATADYPTKAARPAYSVLDTAKLRAAFGVDLPDWRVALDGVLRELATHW